MSRLLIAFVFDVSKIGTALTLFFPFEANFYLSGDPIPGIAQTGNYVTALIQASVNGESEYFSFRMSGVYLFES